MKKVYDIDEARCSDLSGGDWQEEPSDSCIVAAYATKDAAIAALSEWQHDTGATAYPGGPEHSVRCSDGITAKYRMIFEVDLVE